MRAGGAFDLQQALAHGALAGDDLDHGGSVAGGGAGLVGGVERAGVAAGVVEAVLVLGEERVERHGRGDRPVAGTGQARRQGTLFQSCQHIRERLGAGPLGI